MKNVDLSPLQKYINLGSSLGGEVGIFFTSVSPILLGAVLVVLVIHGLTRVPPFSHVIDAIRKDAKKARAEPLTLQVLAPATRIKIYYAMLAAFLFSSVVYCVLFLACVAVAVGVWFWQVEPGINRFGVFAASCVLGPISLFFMWAQSSHANQVASLILRLRRGA